MYNYGVDDDMYLSQQAYSQQLLQQPLNDAVYEPSPRGEDHTPMVQAFSKFLLRFGTALKSMCLVLMVLFYYAFGGRSVFTFQSHAELPTGFHFMMVLLMMVYLLGSLCLGFFQAFVADDSKYTMGFRTGSKILSAAVMMDALSAMLRLVQYLYLYKYLTVAWWTKYNVTKSEWTMFTLHNFLDGLALCSYGIAFFYMEVYHDEGTQEETGWTMLGLFSLAGFFVFTMIFSGFGAVFMLLFCLAAQFTATYWAFLFEPLLDRYAPEFHSRRINSDILPGEKEVGETTYSGMEMPEPSFVRGPGDNYGQGFDNIPPDIPTNYDYSQMRQQIINSPERGVVQNS